ncbi:type IV pilus modification protein PilV [Microbulbifer sp.]|uniref:type IV pilus modification protein PilV n=1 Tax=Microbulbifer sp. TaxID=1908541 RepID=UPI002F94433B
MNKQTGATLIEVLITIVILAVGLLGLSATQVMTLKNSNNAHQRYLAALAAHEMVERMRANPDGVETGAYDNKEVTGAETAVACTSTCDRSQIASLDLYDWGRVISSNLPAGKGKVVRNGTQFTLTVNWKEQHTGEKAGSNAGGAQDSSFEMVVDL